MVFGFVHCAQGSRQRRIDPKVIQDLCKTGNFAGGCVDHAVLAARIIEAVTKGSVGTSIVPVRGESTEVDGQP